MASTEDMTEGVQNLISGMGDQGKSVLGAIQRFIDSVNDAIPDGPGSGLRDRVIDSAFAMTHQVVDASNRMASGIVDSAGKTIGNLTGRDSAESA